MYFGYGMWNSSQEYVEKGKIPPGGMEPLPHQPSQNGVIREKTNLEIENETDIPTAEFDEVLKLSAMAEANRRSRVIPITSLDDDDHITKNELENKNNPDEFSAAIHQSHMDAQAVFEEAKRERERAKLEVALLQCHELAEKVFARLREDKEAQQQEMTKQMVAFQQQTEEVHQRLEELFKSIKPITIQPTVIEEIAEQPFDNEIPNAPPIPTPPPTPMAAVLNELKLQVAKVDADTEEDQLPPPVPSRGPPDDDHNKDAAIIPTTEAKKNDGEKKKTGMSNEVLDELKLAISRAKTSENEAGNEETNQNLSPR